MHFASALLTAAAFVASGVMSLPSPPAATAKAPDQVVVMAGQPFTVLYSAPEMNDPATITLRKGSRDDLQTVGTITNLAVGGHFVWVPSIELEMATDYVLEIKQGNTVTYSGDFALQHNEAASVRLADLAKAATTTPAHAPSKAASSSLLWSSSGHHRAIASGKIAAVPRFAQPEESFAEDDSLLDGLASVGSEVSSALQPTAGAATAPSLEDAIPSITAAPLSFASALPTLSVPSMPSNLVSALESGLATPALPTLSLPPLSLGQDIAQLQSKIKGSLESDLAALSSFKLPSLPTPTPQADFKTSHIRPPLPTAYQAKPTGGLWRPLNSTITRAALTPTGPATVTKTLPATTSTGGAVPVHTGSAVAAIIGGIAAFALLA